MTMMISILTIITSVAVIILIVALILKGPNPATLELHAAPEPNKS